MEEKNIVGELASALRQASVGETEFRGDSVHIRELPGVSILRLHTLPARQELPSCEIELPGITGQCRGENPSALCLRPGEWLLVSEQEGANGLLARFSGDIDPEHSAVYNLSDGLAVFRISGDGTPWLLSKLSSLDYLAGGSTGEHCARTRMGHIAVVVHYHQAGEDRFVFDLIFDRSFAKYFWDLLLASAPHADELAGAYGSAA